MARSSAPLHDVASPRTPAPTASGLDIYAVSAPLVVEACLRLLDAPPAAGGAYVAGELFDARDFLTALTALECYVVARQLRMGVAA